MINRNCETRVTLWVPEMPKTSPDLLILVEQYTEAVPPSDGWSSRSSSDGGVVVVGMVSGAPRDPSQVTDGGGVASGGVDPRARV